MPPSDPDDYELLVAPATDALDEFAAQLISELDDQHGGFTQWIGYSDWKTLTLLSDYLIQTVQGVAEALLLASFAARTHRESSFAEAHAMKTAAREGGSIYPLDRHGRRRQLTMTQSLEACFFHMGQSLDLLAAALVIVGGFEISGIAGLDWKAVIEIAEDLANGSSRQRYQPTGSAGRLAQEALMAPYADWDKDEPEDWLPWMRDTRNGFTHRAAARKMTVSTTDRRIVRLLYRQPRWSELQSLIFGSRPPRRAVIDSFVMSASDDVLQGLCRSLTTLVEAFAKSMVACWHARTSDPQMIVQHGKQWPQVEPTDTLWNFPGYGPVTISPKSALVTHPGGARRWASARAMDDRRQDWYKP